MKKPSEQLVYSDGRPVRLGDIVTGCVDTEPFLAQVAFIYPDGERAQVVPLSRPPSLRAAASLFRRQTSVATTYWDVPAQLSALRLHQRCNGPATEHAVIVARDPNAIADKDWRKSAVFCRLPKPQRRWRNGHDKAHAREAGL
jgi:hypothetical protein